jgi:DUF4097 and DUF4098 domain-containing protein YvlB
MRQYVTLFFLPLLFVGLLPAQSFTTSPCSDDEGGASNNWFAGHQDRACELRRATLPLVNGQLSVSGENGGIDVVGEERQDIALEAQVITQDSSREEAQSLAHEIKIVTTGTIHAEGPKAWGFSHRNWSVNWRLRVPRHVAAELHTMNGGIHVTNVVGAINADTTNGGLTLTDLGGDVHAKTVNGGLDVRLDGNEWHGAGMVASSTNGGVDVHAPSEYSAHLVAETVNGGISVGFPITVQGKIGRRIDTNLGQGGATLHFHTVNGGVSIRPSHPI